MAPENAELHYNLGLAYKLKDDLPAAILELNRTIELDPKLPDPHYTLGVVLWQSGKFPEAEKELNQVVALKPDYAEAYYTLGTVYKQSDDLPRAAEALRKAIQLQPDFAGAHTTLAAVLRQQGDTEGASAESKLAAQITERSMTLQNAVFSTNSGIKLMNAGDLDGAISQFEAAIRAESSFAPAHRQLAAALMRKGDKQGAGRELAIFEQLQHRKPVVQ